MADNIIQTIYSGDHRKLLVGHRTFRFNRRPKPILFLCGGRNEADVHAQMKRYPDLGTFFYPDSTTACTWETISKYHKDNAIVWQDGCAPPEEGQMVDNSPSGKETTLRREHQVRMGEVFRDLGGRYNLYPRRPKLQHDV